LTYNLDIEIFPASLFNPLLVLGKYVEPELGLYRTGEFNVSFNVIVF